MNKIQITAVIISILALIVSLVSLGKMMYDIGYDDGWKDGTAHAESWGWQSCIEENNLYERYEQ